MDKTVTVLVERRVEASDLRQGRHKSNKYHAHDENNECKAGDLVEIEASRKLSKTKAWRVCASSRRRKVGLDPASSGAGIAEGRNTCHNRCFPRRDATGIHQCAGAAAHPSRMLVAHPRRDPKLAAAFRVSRFAGTRSTCAGGGSSWRELSHDSDAVGAGRRRQHRRALGHVHQGAGRQQAPLRAHRRRDQGVASRKPRRAAA